MNSKLAKLRAFAPVDGSGRIVYNATVYRKKMPKGANRWVELATTQCCNNEAPTVDSISAEADPTSILEGETSQLTVTATLSDSTTQNVTSQATYSSSDEAVATVSGGVVTGVAAGSADITIEYGGQTTSVTITVTAEE